MNSRLVAFFVLVLCSGPMASAAGPEQPGASVSCTQLQSLTSSIDELTSALGASMEMQQQQQSVLIAIQYLQFRTRNIEGLEAEVRRVEDRKISAEERIERMSRDLRSMERRLEVEESEKADDLASAIDRYSRMLETEQGRVDRYERQIIDLENRILDSRRRLMDLEDFVIEHLDAGP